MWSESAKCIPWKNLSLSKYILGVFWKWEVGHKFKLMTSYWETYSLFIFCNIVFFKKGSIKILCNRACIDNSMFAVGMLIFMIFGGPYTLLNMYLGYRAITCRIVPNSVIIECFFTHYSIFRKINKCKYIGIYQSLQSTLKRVSVFCQITDACMYQVQNIMWTALLYFTISDSDNLECLILS